MNVIHGSRGQFQLLATCLALLVALGCGGPDDDDPQKEKDPGPPPIPNDGPIPPKSSLKCPDGTVLSYETFGESFMVNYCTSCHSSELKQEDRAGAPKAVNLDTPENVALYRAKILKVAVGDDPNMPPSKNVPQTERQLLKEWLQCGAPRE